MKKISMMTLAVLAVVTVSTVSYAVPTIPTKTGSLTSTPVGTGQGLDPYIYPDAVTGRSALYNNTTASSENANLTVMQDQSDVTTRSVTQTSTTMERNYY
jgi:hypothetical protein